MPANDRDHARVKVPILDSREPRDWRNWRFTLERACVANGFSGDRSITEAIACMTGPAKSIITHLPTANKTFKEYLDAIEAVILSPAASTLARAKFHASVQSAEESIIDWHVRLKDKFIDGYPTEAEDCNTKKDLISRFCNKLKDPLLARMTAQAKPATYEAALREAQDAMAILIEQRQYHPQHYGEGKGNKASTAALNAITDPHTPTGSANWSHHPTPWNSSGPTTSSAPPKSGKKNQNRCSYCGIPGHSIDSPCRSFVADSNARKLANKDRGRNRNRGRGGRGRNNRGSKPYDRKDDNERLINAVGSQREDDDLFLQAGN